MKRRAEESAYPKTPSIEGEGRDAAESRAEESASERAAGRKEPHDLLEQELGFVAPPYTLG